MLRKALLWLLAIPLCVAGSQVAHSLAYRIVDPDQSTREHLLASTGHGYLAYAPLASALATALILVATACLALQGRRVGHVRLSVWLYVLLPPIVFALQEHLERLAHDGRFPFDAILEPTFVAGVALQLPFSVAAYALARLLLGAAKRLVALGHGRERTLRARPPERAILRPTQFLVAPGKLLGLRLGGRAPPLVA